MTFIQSGLPKDIRQFQLVSGTFPISLSKEPGNFKIQKHDSIAN